MKPRQITIVLAVLVIIAGIVGKNQLAASKEDPKKNEHFDYTKGVKVITIANGDVQSGIDITGKLVGNQKVELFSEVQGVLLNGSKMFKEGVAYSKGEVIFQLDASEAKMALLAQRSAFLNLLISALPDVKIDYPNDFTAWNAYAEQLNINKDLAELPAVSSPKLKNFLSIKNIYNQYYSIKSAEARLDKFVITAPFDGVVSVANINNGTLVRAGQKLGEFLSTAEYELEAAISINDIELVNIGDSVQLKSNDMNGRWNGVVKRVSDKIDPATQTLKVFVKVAGNRLFEGMYLSGKIKAGILHNAVELPRKALVDGDNVFVVQGDSSLMRIPVQIEKYNENTVIVSGAENGIHVLEEAFNGAYNGMKVSIIN